MKYVLTVAAMIAAFTPALAESAAELQVVKRDGITYRFTETRTDGLKRLVGRDSNGHSFDLTVKGDRVVGIYGGQSMNYAAPKTSLVRLASK